MSDVGTDRRTFIKALGATAVAGTAAVALGTMADPASAATDISGKKSGTQTFSDDMVVPAGDDAQLRPRQGHHAQVRRGPHRPRHVADEAGKPGDKARDPLHQRWHPLGTGGRATSTSRGHLGLPGTAPGPATPGLRTTILKVTPVAKGDYTIRNFDKGGNRPLDQHRPRYIQGGGVQPHPERGHPRHVLAADGADPRHVLLAPEDQVRPGALCRDHHRGGEVPHPLPPLSWRLAGKHPPGGRGDATRTTTGSPSTARTG